MSPEVRKNVSRGATWIRGLYMLLFALIFNLAELVLAAVALFQFAAHLLAGKPNTRLRDFGAKLGAYLQEIAAFLTYASEDRPFPFAPWPGGGESQPVSGDHGDEAPEESRGKVGDEGDAGGGEPNEAGVR
ncbi:DUF4389 domain-containing protein [Thiohalorhabdus denitrificans]|uniref:Lipase n=1 Tax=Thiohalorhabdus denitrificans TaxID=381306 RepID=A0A1G5GX67_9GAMM|nr:DUF4389 domain-containing protein [Thiohalorhabdus denitrificans]SCY55899.1 protein of unknown function [Thiohalorhabdus denitrificans]